MNGEVVSFFLQFMEKAEAMDTSIKFRQVEERNEMFRTSNRSKQSRSKQSRSKQSRIKQ
jgi:hypothetical protein